MVNTEHKSQSELEYRRDIKSIDSHTEIEKERIRNETGRQQHAIEHITGLAKLIAIVSGITLTTTLIVIAIDSRNPNSENNISEQLAGTIVYQSGCILGSLATLFVRSGNNSN